MLSNTFHVSNDFSIVNHGAIPKRGGNVCLDLQKKRETKEYLHLCFYLARNISSCAQKWLLSFQHILCTLS
jgi:hypothetical protein